MLINSDHSSNQSNKSLGGFSSSSSSSNGAASKGNAPCFVACKRFFASAALLLFLLSSSFLSKRSASIAPEISTPTLSNSGWVVGGWTNSSPKYVRSAGGGVNPSTPKSLSVSFLGGFSSSSSSSSDGLFSGKLCNTLLAPSK